VIMKLEARQVEVPDHLWKKTEELRRRYNLRYNKNLSFDEFLALVFEIGLVKLRAEEIRCQNVVLK